ncbi:GNAT family N-acetyltransferase [Nocardia carnea]|uniref:GNAT family N-acetyltransferase n=1 Tax=Nocardia carnea TaxID=37328 RepID=UPI002454EF71|nr:GNAT family protein [Nocardia carnea]
MRSEFWQHPPRLRGDHVLLRPLEPGDAEELAAAHDDPGTLRYFPEGIESRPPSAETVAHALSSGRQVLVPVDLRDNRIVGTTSLYNMEAQHGRVTIGFTWYSRRVRGTVINPEAKLLLLDHVFGTLAAHRAEFTVDDRNTRSRAAVTALGATQEGILRQHALRRDGSRRNTVIYSILAEEWPAARDRLTERLARRVAETVAPDRRPAPPGSPGR